MATADRYQVIVSVDASELDQKQQSADGEPIDIGRKSRMWPPAMARTIKNRD